MVLRFAAALSFLLVWGMASGQNCTLLNVGRTDAAPQSGASLSVCEVSDSQCCTQDFLDSVRSDIGEALLEGIRDQLKQPIDVVNELVKELGSYFQEKLVVSIRENIPFVRLHKSSSPSIALSLSNLLSRVRFNIDSTSAEVNTSKLIIHMLTGVRMLIQRSSNYSDDQKTCLVNKLNNINQSASDLLGERLNQVRRANSVLIRILHFLENFQNELGGFTVSHGCITQAINIGFCGRCKNPLPPLCSNTCGSLVRGCYAAFFSGLQMEFNSLWKVVRQIITLIEEGVKNIEQTELNMLEENEESSITACQVTTSVQRTNFIAPPSTLMTDANQLRNVFIYGNSGPEFCDVESSEKTFCQNANGELSNRICKTNQLCTSSCMCWDGTTTRTKDTEVFSGDVIADQGNNPVFRGILEEYKKAATKLGTPVHSFLTSTHITEVLPQNLSLPEPMPYDAGEGHAIISMATLIGVMVLVFVL